MKSSSAYLAGTLVLFGVLAAALTYPQIRGLRDQVHDDGDPLLNAWALAWVAHQLPRAPAHLFDANIFYPERRTLAYSETLLVPGVAAAPLAWAGAGPLLVYNLVFLAGMIVSGAGTALLVRDLTGSGAAGVLAGIVFACLPFRIDHEPHLQLQQTQFIPFALWAFHRWIDNGRVRDALWFGVCVAAEALSCVYDGLFLVPYLAVVCAALAWRRPIGGRRAAGLALAAIVAAVAVAPTARAYLGARRVVGERPAAEVASASATLENYLGPPEANLLYGRALSAFAAPERHLFPGFVAMALALVALWPPLSRPRVAYALGLIVALDVSLGFNGFTYRVLYDYVLPFRALRIPARMGVMVGFSLAVLSGFGAARILKRASSLTGFSGLGGLGAPAAIAGAIAVLMMAEYVNRPIDLQRMQTEPPAVYSDLLREVGDGPAATVFEFPVSDGDDPTYMYYSTFHWQHLLNGYSGFFPPSYTALQSSMIDFPDDASLATLRARGARYVIVHGERLYGGRYQDVLDRLAARHDVTLIARRPAEREGQHGEAALYRVN